MVKHTKTIKNKIKNYILECINSDDEILRTDHEKLAYADNRFISEFGFRIKQIGKFKAFSEWLGGLALDFDYMNYKILELAEEWGQITKTETQQNNICDVWWDFLTSQFFRIYKEVGNNTFKLFVPPTNEVGSFSSVVSSENWSKEKDALLDYNNAREHDSLTPLSRMPKGTKYVKIFEVQK